MIVELLNVQGLKYIPETTDYTMLMDFERGDELAFHIEDGAECEEGEKTWTQPELGLALLERPDLAPVLTSMVERSAVLSASRAFLGTNKIKIVDVKPANDKDSHTTVTIEIDDHNGKNTHDVIIDADASLITLINMGEEYGNTQSVFSHEDLHKIMKSMDAAAAADRSPQFRGARALIRFYLALADSFFLPLEAKEEMLRINSIRKRLLS